MKHLGFSDSAIYWFRSYLTSQTFFIDIGKETSSPGDLSHGIPQGSGLGPLTFLLYVNDMPRAVDCDPLLYTDDSCLAFRGNDTNEIEKQLNKDLKSLCDWVVDNIHISTGDIKIKQYTAVTYLQ